MISLNSMKNLKKIKNIQNNILSYYEMSFENDNEDYIYNKSIKEKLKQIIIDSKDNPIIVEKALLVLAASTGCAEDQQIAEEICNYLFDNQFINNKQLDFFYNNIRTDRWY